MRIPRHHPDDIIYIFFIGNLELELDLYLPRLHPGRWGRFKKYAMVKSGYMRTGHLALTRESLERVYINPYWIDDHPLSYGNNESMHGGFSSSYSILGLPLPVT